jgi:NAD-dependent deacetylase
VAERCDQQSLLDNARMLAGMIGEARRMVVFTGAGISTESGVPDFRSPGSPWLANPPLPFADFLASREARLEAWRRKFVMDDLYRHAKPTRAHSVIARWIQSGESSCVITQNIDGLHTQSGLPPEKVIELHGNGTYAVCLDCGERHTLGWVRGMIAKTGEPPQCEACSGMVKSATISFGQPLPVEILRRARQLSERADLFLVMGSSLVVRPAAMLPLVAKQAGAVLVIINREVTPMYNITDMDLHGDIGEIIDDMRNFSEF